ncbi:MAG: serine/threonine-protein kinase [Gemmatimonadales bacterium]|nr:serine/threonine-protein kinase [Gemmatimonadales bacterium]
MSEATTPDDDFLGLQDALAGQWSLERELGRGGMATVYLARDVSLDRPVAIKVLSAAHAADPGMRARFAREAVTSARLSHPHIVPTYAVAEAAGRPYLVMGYIDGESLAQRLHRTGPMPLAEGERVIREVAWALGHAHATGVLHRDVTLDNILLERSTGRAVLVDFGIAGLIDGEGDGTLLGTPAYLAPEVIQGEPASRASDLYALATVAWATFAGRLPYHGGDSASVLLQQVTAPVPSLASAAPALPRRIVAAIEGALVKQPDARPVTVEAWMSTWQGHNVTVPLATPLVRWREHWREVRSFYALAATLTAMFGAVGGAVYVGWGTARATWLIQLFAIAIPLTLVAAMVHAITASRQLRGLSRAGYGIEDLRLALRDRSPDAERRAVPLVGRLTSDAVLLALVIYLGTGWLLRQVEDGAMGWFVSDYYRQVAQWAYVVFWSGLGLSLLTPTRPLLPPGTMSRLRRFFWDSWAGAFWLGLARVGLGKRIAAAETLHRPTELVLDLAIEELWRALPATARREASELPAVARALRKRVAALRGIAGHFGEPSHDTPAESALRAKVNGRISAALTALEQLRLQLLRLDGATVPTGALTAQLHDARSLERELLADLGAHRGVGRLLRRGASRRSPGMTPTPA